MIAVARACLCACVAAWLPAVAAAEPAVIRVPYSELVPELTRVVDFERLPRRAEPGFNLDMPLFSGGAWLGERFSGQSIAPTDTGHDRITGQPDPGPLRVAPGAPGRNLNIAYHRGFGSNALFPLGPAGFPALEARGEGAVAILFDHDQAALGFRVHTEYPDPLGQRPVQDGRIEVRFLARDGALLARITLDSVSGISELGFRRAGQRRDIAGILILNTDPGGIALDDIRFARPPLLG